MRVVNSVFDEIPRGLRIWGAVDGILQDKFGHYFPDDAHEICSGRVGVSVFQVHSPHHFVFCFVPCAAVLSVSQRRIQIGRPSFESKENS